MTAPAPAPAAVGAETHRSRAASLLTRARALDPLDAWLRHLDGLAPSGDPQICLDVAIELAGVGEHEAALATLDVVERLDRTRAVGQVAAGPLVGYHRAHVHTLAGRPEEAARARTAARAADTRWCFPGRLADARVLVEAAAAEELDPVARALLGHWTYAVGRHEDAARLWQESAELDPTDAVVRRNLGLAAAVTDIGAAERRYEAALALAPDDARLLFERDQLAALADDDPADRVHRLRRLPELVGRRDDLVVELAHLLVTTDAAQEALDLLTGRRFQPWEGGEGQVLAAWERSRTLLALRAIADGDPERAAEHLAAALVPPATLGEARHPLASTARLALLLGDAHAAAGRSDAARQTWADAAGQRGDFLAMSTTEHSETTFWTVLALRRSGQHDAAVELRESLRRHRDEDAAATPVVDYFATSLPDLLLFETDPLLVRDRRVAVFDAQLALLTGEGGGEPGVALAQAARLLAAPTLAADRHAADLRHAIATLGEQLLTGPIGQPGPGGRADTVLDDREAHR